ncbi:MAG: PD-(D/E)XK nuclease superfamily protein [Chloroflexia bacterium]
MNPRNTTTGAVLEQMILPALEHGGYQYQTRVHIGQRLGRGKHIIDVLAKDREGRQFLISLKWQQVSGTAEQKVPFEAMCLAEAVRSSQGKYHKAYLVLGGDGWKLRDFFVGGDLQSRLLDGNLVNIVTLETFVRLANQGKL